MQRVRGGWGMPKQQVSVIILSLVILCHIIMVFDAHVLLFQILP